MQEPEFISENEMQKILWEFVIWLVFGDPFVISISRFN